MSRFGLGFIGSTKKSLIFQTSDSDGSDGPNYTFSSQAIGPADPAQVVIVGVTGQGGSPRTITSVTIGGVSATEVVYNAGGNRSAAIWIAAVPTGDTADIQVSWTALPSGSMRPLKDSYIPGLTPQILMAAHGTYRLNMCRPGRPIDA